MSLSLGKRSLQHAGRRHGIRPRYYSDETRTRTESAPAPNQAESQPLTGSTKLFSDARQEDLSGSSTRPKSAHLQALESQVQDTNWDGEERIQDAVLRMLVDKYKPLRGGNGSGSGIESADEKLKRNVPRVAERSHSSWEDNRLIRTMPAASSVAPRLEPSQTGAWATEPLFPSTENHKPWHTTFKVPSHVEASIKFASLSTAVPTRPSFSSSSSELSSSTSPNGIKDDKTRRLEREAKRRGERAGRLTKARESTLDYKMGITPGMKNLNSVAGQGGRVNPVTVKGWASLVEDQIERARSRGAFDAVKGRGMPLAKTQEELNPFIGREEFLMNRIVQRNGAAPPWVEVQAELESSIHTFRQILRQSWIRRALRLLRSTTPAERLDIITLSQIKGLRDEEWFRRERTYHETALAEVNAMVRKHNTLAPYAVRKPYYMLELEIGRLFEECAAEIFNEAKKTPDGVEQVEVVARGEGSSLYGFGDFVRETLAKLGWMKPR